MNVHLTPEYEAMVDGKVKSGQYNSPSEVVQDALALLERRDLVREDIRQKIKAGWDSARAGRVSDGEEFMAQMMAELDEEIRQEDELAARQLAGAK